MRSHYGFKFLFLRLVLPAQDLRGRQYVFSKVTHLKMLRSQQVNLDITFGLCVDANIYLVV